MKFAFNGVDYRISFRHHFKGTASAKVVTVALLDRKMTVYSPPFDYETVARGEAFTFGKTFCKETKRKQALAKAVRELFPDRQSQLAGRTEVWKCYFSRKVARRARKIAA